MNKIIGIPNNNRVFQTSSLLIMSLYRLFSVEAQIVSLTVTRCCA